MAEDDQTSSKKSSERGPKPSCSKSNDYDSDEEEYYNIEGYVDFAPLLNVH
jgi:hypothetical protein